MAWEQVEGDILNYIKIIKYSISPTFKILIICFLFFFFWNCSGPGKALLLSTGREDVLWVVKLSARHRKQELKSRGWGSWWQPRLLCKRKPNLTAQAAGWPEGSKTRKRKCRVFCWYGTSYIWNMYKIKFHFLFGHISQLFQKFAHNKQDFIQLLWH